VLLSSEIELDTHSSTLSIHVTYKERFSFTRITFDKG